MSRSCTRARSVRPISDTGLSWRSILQDTRVRVHSLFCYPFKFERLTNFVLGSKEFECRKGNCKRRFFSMPSRKKHENNCKGMNLLEVSFGQESSATCSETMEMQLSTEIRVYPCKNCPRKFDTEGGLSKHAWRCKEPDQNRQLHTCEICSMEFLNAKNLDAHMNKHNGKSFSKL